MSRLNRRADEFERALTAGGVPADATMAAMVSVASALTALPQRPAPAFREALRAQLMTEAASVAASVAAVPAAVPGAAWQVVPKILAKPAMQVATGGLAAVIAATGVSVGAARSVLGDPLYGLRRAVERLQGAEADVTIEQARTRLAEITALLDGHHVDALEEVEGALRALKAELDAATNELLTRVRAGSRAAYETLAASLANLQRDLNALRGALPHEAVAELEAAMGSVNTAAAMLRALPVPPRGTPPISPRPTTPRPPTSSPASITPSTEPSVPTKTPTIPVPSTPPVTIPVPSLSVSLPADLP